MIRLTTSLLVLFAANPSPSPASGFPSRPLDLCTPGRFSTCASVQLSVIQNPVGSMVVLRIRNMQGSNPYDRSRGSTLAQFLLTTSRPNFFWFDVDRPCPGCFGRFTTEGPVRTYGNVEPGKPLNVDITYYDGLWGTGVAWLLFDSQNPLALGLFGCDEGPFPRADSEGGRTANALGTCPAQGYTGWFTWIFQTNQRIYPHELGYELSFWDVDDTRTWCTYHTPYGSTCIVTPEPATLSLLATGLGSLGVALWRRRLASSHAPAGFSG